MNGTWMWLSLLGLGALHGVNPGMGWLFAVGTALQTRDRGAVWRALGPLALGHALAIGAVVAVAAALDVVMPTGWLRWLTGALLVCVGVLHLTRHAHPRFGGMRMSGRELTVWSFLMATAHGAGLMALPLVLRAKDGAAGVHSGLRHAAEGMGHGAHGALSAGIPSSASLGLGATAVHTLGYLAVTGVLAWVVYEKLGVRFLRRAWLNVDLLWGVALIVTGVLAALA